MQAWGRAGENAVAHSVAAVLREIEAMCLEREQGPVRRARLRLAAAYGQARLVRRRERESA